MVGGGDQIVKAHAGQYARWPAQQGAGGTDGEEHLSILVDFQQHIGGGEGESHIDVQSPGMGRAAHARPR